MKFRLFHRRSSDQPQPKGPGSLTLYGGAQSGNGGGFAVTATAANGAVTLEQWHEWDRQVLANRVSPSSLDLKPRR